MNICKDCKHNKDYGILRSFLKCCRPLGEIDVVTGKHTRHLCVPCEQERKSGECGMEGKFFAERGDPFKTYNFSNRAAEPREDAKSEYYRAKADAIWWRSHPTGSDF